MHNVLKGTSMMKVLCTRAANCDSGATSMEYALIAAIVSVVFLTGADTLSSVLNDKFMSLSTKLDIATQDREWTVDGAELVSSQSFMEGNVLAISYSPQSPQD